MLEERLALAQKTSIRERLGFGGKEFRRWSKQLKRLRDHLAHGGTVLDCEAEPRAAIELIWQVHTFGQRVWETVESRLLEQERALDA